MAHVEVDVDGVYIFDHEWNMIGTLHPIPVFTTFEDDFADGLELPPPGPVPVSSIGSSYPVAGPPRDDMNHM